MMPTIISLEEFQKARGKVVLDCFSNGLTEEDALTLAEWSQEDFDLYKKSNERFSQLCERKKVEYKKTLMTPITKAIQDGDSRLAQWMLERQFHNEFSGKKRPAEQLSNPIALIINQIQGNQSMTVLPGSNATRKQLLKDKRAKQEEDNQEYTFDKPEPMQSDADIEADEFFKK